MDWIANACRSNPPAHGVDRLRLPGERGLKRRLGQLEHGVTIKAPVTAALSKIADKLGVSIPKAL